MKPLAQNTLIQNRYLIVHLIGKGGMGEVYLAVDQRLGSAVALKRTFFADDELLGGAFEREARTLARLRHPVLPKVSDHFTEGSEQYLVMEHISGDDLMKRLELAQKPFPVSWVMFWADQLLDALSYLHSHEPPIIHRDIKPQNLKLTDENHIVLLDFGLSKSSTGKTQLTSGGGSTGSVVGYTPHYAPMEQIRGIGTSPRSDLYSLSATLYQLLTNTVPPDALTRADAMLNGSADPLQSIDEINPEVAKPVSDIIVRGMEVSQEKRFASAREMQKSLRQAFTQMQQAMSAETVAFNVSAVDVPAGAIPSVSDAQTRIAAPPNGSEQPPTSFESAVAPPPVDLDSTIAIDPGEVSGVRQSDIRTEVFTPNSNPFPAGDSLPRNDRDERPEPEQIAPEPQEQAPVEPQWAKEEPAEAFSPEATVPFIAMETAAPEYVADVEAEPSPERAAAFSSPAVRDPQPSQVTVSAGASRPPAAKSSGKAFLILGGLALFFVLIAGGAGAGWYFYNNYAGIAAETEPTPTPLPAETPLPTPEPTVESVVAPETANTNTGTDPADETNTSTADAETVPEPTPASAPPSTGERPVATRATPQPRATRPSSTPAAAKPTPQPKRTTDRTVILQ